MKPEIPEIEPDIPQNAVSVYDQDGAQEDFPVLKAFQQYIDAEQEKARKRMLTMAVFFGLFTLCVVAVFVALLMYVSERNQKLNDRLVEFAMQERAKPVPAATSPVVVQPPQDSSAILALTAKLDEMQKKLAADQAKAEREAKEAAARAEKAAIEAARPKGPSKEELEIQKLKEQLRQRELDEQRRIAEAKKLAADKLAEEKAKLEKEVQHQAEIEAYRRKHYPEFYKKQTIKPKKKRVIIEEDDEEVVDESEDIDALLKEINENKAIRYYDDEDEEDETQKSPSLKKKTSSSKKNYSIPVDVKGSSDRSWSIPEE